MPLLSKRGACGVKLGLRKEREAVDPGHGVSLETILTLMIWRRQHLRVHTVLRTSMSVILMIMMGTK